MKEMVYSTHSKREILYSGKYKDHKFYILSLGTHPTAYVECKLKDCNGCYDERLDNINVHGGFTYFGRSLWGIDDKKYLGWDYAHFMDYLGCNDNGFNKKWTTAEIYEEVKAVIEQLEGIEKKRLASCYS